MHRKKYARVRLAKSQLSLSLLFASCVLSISLLQVSRLQSIAKSPLESQNLLVDPNMEAEQFRGVPNLRKSTHQTPLPEPSLSASSSDFNSQNQLVSVPERTAETSESDGAVILPESELTASVKILLKEATRSRPIFDEVIDPAKEEERCKRYQFGYNGRKTRRRIFWGSLMADDSWHAIGATALEVHGIFEAAAFVESNRTQMYAERTLRFGPTSANTKMLQSGIFGPKTSVTMDYFVDEPPSDRKVQFKKEGLVRENLQRELILHRWRESGMREDDIGLISDVDETFTRDFLRAAQICDVPEFRSGSDCKAAMVSASTLSFESSPECIVKPLIWHYPGMVLGECINMIGDPNLHKSVPRTYLNVSGWRENGYGGMDGSYSKMQNTSMYPLWNAADFRYMNGRQYTGINRGHTGYHFHNFFLDLATVRFKYKTYGHPVWNADELPLVSIHHYLDFMADCVMDRSEEGNKRSRLQGGLKSITGHVPLAFQLSSYSAARHSELLQVVGEDEETYPPPNETMRHKYQW